jgi:hypothetical protein
MKPNPAEILDLLVEFTKKYPESEYTSTLIQTCINEMKIQLSEDDALDFVIKLQEKCVF